MSSIGEVENLRIPLEDILSATNNFDEKNFIGMGGFGRVYQGQSPKYGALAVKRLSVGSSLQGQKEFMMEIALLSAYKHENLVSLVGFCDQDGAKILVYKHESNGSLDKLLRSKDLNWIQRPRISIDAARGLKYLHDDVGPQRIVVHRDIKSANILLDEEFKGKISDFGLSKINPVSGSSSILISNACGTLGYIDPGYLIYGALTEKSDVYSFGIVLFEVLCGRPAQIVSYQDKRHILCILAPDHHKKGTIDEIIKPELREQMDAASLHVFSTIAYQCLKSRDDRPTMIRVVEELQKALDYQVQATSGLAGDAHISSGDQDVSNHTFDQTRYDVYLSLNEADIKKNFGDRLRTTLLQKGINPCVKDYTFDLKDTVVDLSLEKTVRESRIVLIVLSKEYAYSSRCLHELELALKNKIEIGQMVIPIFYGVDPMDVRRQTGEYEKAMASQEGYFNIMTTNKWRKALTNVVDLKGWTPGTDHVDRIEMGHTLIHVFDDKAMASHAKKFGTIKKWGKALANVADFKGRTPGTNADGSNFIKSVVDKICHSLLHSMLVSSVYIREAGRTTPILDLKSQLQVGYGGVRMVGICGSRGSGKSILASTIYGEIHHEFESCWFVKNVGGESRMHGLETLQQNFLSIHPGDKKMAVRSIEEGISLMRHTTCLIVLDGVDHLDQLKALAGSEKWFGNGSRIIITARDKNLLKAHNINMIHIMTPLCKEEAIELFSRHAFGKHKPVEGHEDVLLEMVNKSGGHPSTLVGLGSFLKGKVMREWMSTSTRLHDLSAEEVVELYSPAGDDGSSS